MTVMLKERSLRTGAVLARTFALLRGSLHRAVIAVAIIGGLGVLVDSGTLPNDAARALNLGLSVGSAFLQYWLILTLLEDLGQSEATGGRFGGYFVMGIVTTLALLIGAFVLIVPAVVLAVRWSIAGPLLIGSDRRIFEAIGESWRATSGHFSAILLAALTLYVPLLLLAIGGAVAVEFLGSGLTGVVVANAGFALYAICGCYLSVAIYVLIAPLDTVSVVFE